MKRSDFFKSLAGIAIAPIIGAQTEWKGREEFEQKYDTKDNMSSDLPKYPGKAKQGYVPTGMIVSSAWDCESGLEVWQLDEHGRYVLEKV